MSWFLLGDDKRRESFGAGALGGAYPTVTIGLGSAYASRNWGWARSTPARIPSARTITWEDDWDDDDSPIGGTVVRIPDTVMRRMLRAARDAGLSDSALWAEAARAWLATRPASAAADDEPRPPTPPAAALPRPRVPRAWAAIDAVLADLRAPTLHRVTRADTSEATDEPADTREPAGAPAA
ncbi:MAG: hypothetical protein OJF49_003374 [Ktedonobacterales bacterium]|jgi:hypothetical protein|nr:MAG: hypothetical protein OJF49_003374 [Ktedonobacterales bacterium]